MHAGTISVPREVYAIVAIFGCRTRKTDSLGGEMGRYVFLRSCCFSPPHRVLEFSIGPSSWPGRRARPRSDAGAGDQRYRYEPNQQVVPVATARREDGDTGRQEVAAQNAEADGRELRLGDDLHPEAREHYPKSKSPSTRSAMSTGPSPSAKCGVAKLMDASPHRTCFLTAPGGAEPDVWFDATVPLSHCALDAGRQL